jgi:hypothetical protein
MGISGFSTLLFPFLAPILHLKETLALGGLGEASDMALRTLHPPRAL